MPTLCALGRAPRPGDAILPCDCLACNALAEVVDAMMSTPKKRKADNTDMTPKKTKTNDANKGKAKKGENGQAKKGEAKKR